MSSITTAIPTGLITSWCIGAAAHFDDGSRYECQRDSPGWSATNFQTFCCDGDILNTAKDIWRDIGDRGKNNSIDMADMICCGLGGAQQGGIHPLPTAYTACSAGAPTPLASIAGTNTDNAVPFRVTYTSASFGGDGGTVVGDYIPTERPTCFWAYTVGVGTTEVTLPAPDITTLPPDTTDEFGFTVATPTTGPRTTTMEKSASEPTGTTGSSGDDASSSGPRTTVLTGTGTGTQSSSEVPSESTSTPSGASAVTGVGKGYMCLGLGLVTVSLLWS
ncbi:hypothetical protein F5Y00DRAFT_242187 [Daldinia vernicosa]|uniref:uncharacterized protein n=1 Tax=Daldinia vernicosa TaxID=114800 RepID=UPI0020086057|nr:uncharacterized protein F5Y00DRAFT_242187 [Daldinia vernicosa]KAI0847070.1 hypothetical protein F5Y00DRAFT_242187 [Daldinia vernicosa]